MLIISPSGPAGRKTPKNTLPKRARTAGKGKRGAGLTISGNMTGTGAAGLLQGDKFSLSSHHYEQDK